MKKFLIRTATVLACTGLFAACVDGPNRDTEKTIFVDHSSLDLFVGEEVQITASPTGETFVWESDDPTVATASNGTVTAIGEGITNIVVSYGDVRRAIPVNVEVLIPATGISVSRASMTLKRGEITTITAGLIPENSNDRSALLWQSSDPDVAQVTGGVIEAVNCGLATVTVMLEDNPSVKAEIDVFVPTINLSSFTTDAGKNLSYGQVDFTKDAEITIAGLDPSEFGAVYNRDFFSYDSNTGQLTFTGETGTYDVYYSGKYNYFWVARMNNPSPDDLWLVGNGFACSPVWNSDFDYFGWNTSDIRQLAYMKPLGDGKYQATIYISSSHDWGDVEIAISNTAGASLVSPTLTGDCAGMYTYSWGICTWGGTGFGFGYNRLTVDVSNVDLSTGTGAVINFEKLN
jgi:hypothetical protein